MKDLFISSSAKGSLLLVIAAAGLWIFVHWLFNGPQPPEKIFAGGREEVTFLISPDSSRVRVRGLSAEALEYLREKPAGPERSKILRVYAFSPGRTQDPAATPSDGALHINGDEIVYDARHAWLPDVNYYVRMEGLVTADTSFVVDPPAGLEPVQVAGVYPSPDSLPQNLLKFYIQFSGPMSRGGVYEHISILDERGKNIPDAFLELPQELWDPLATRLTILFDPGRIKRGLERHNLRGAAFEPGHHYTLVIERNLKGSNGLPLESEVRKRFYIAEPDRTMPDYEAWDIDIPSAGTRETLQLRFDEPLDQALQHRVITVKRDSEEIPGAISVADEERTWRFVPDRPWREGDYNLEIEAILEDLAGNNLISVFDVDLAAGREQQVNRDVGSTIVKEFVVE